MPPANPVNPEQTPAQPAVPEATEPAGIADIDVEQPETPLQVEEEKFETGLPAPDATDIANIQLDVPEALESSQLSEAPVEESTTETVEASTEKGEISREEVIERLQGIGKQLNKLVEEYAAKPLVAEVPKSTESVKPAVLDNVVSIYTRGQQPANVAPPEPVTPIGVPEALQAHSAPELTVVPDPVTSTDIPGVIPTTGQEVNVPTQPVVDHMPSQEELDMLRPQATE